MQSSHSRTRMRINGKIQLLRFLMATSIIMTHINQQFFNFTQRFVEFGSYAITLARHANMGVEFFFIVGGFLTAKSLAKLSPAQRTDLTHLGTQTIQFLWHKARAVLPYSVPLCLVMLIAQHQMLGQDFTLDYVLRRLPNFFFLQRSGISEASILTVDWYISSMLIAYAFLYPILRAWYEPYAHLFGPVIAVLFVGYAIRQTHQLGGTLDWVGITYKSNIRAFTELSLGVTAYEASEWLRAHSFTKMQRALLGLLEFCCYGLVFAYFYSDLPYYCDAYMPFLLSIAVTLSFSQTGLFAESRLFQNGLCVYLGNISLPLFLCQFVFIRTVAFYFPDERLAVKTVLIYGGALATAVIMYEIHTRIARKRAART